MTVKELIEQLQSLDQEKNIWLFYDPPFSCGEVEITPLVGFHADYAMMFKAEGVKEGDYAIIAG